MFRFGMGELLIIFFIILLLFGARRLPEIAGALGKSLTEFKRSVKEEADGGSKTEDPA